MSSLDVLNVDILIARFKIRYKNELGVSLSKDKEDNIYFSILGKYQRDGFDCAMRYVDDVKLV